jgi:hypothetical protein
VTSNAVEVILRVPLQPVVAQVDYLTKAEYGVTPKYLEQVKAEILTENALIDEFVAAQIQTYDVEAPQQVTVLPEEERTILIQKLKSKWDAVNKRYQVLCMHTVYEGNRKAAKEGFEAEMNKIEGDLNLLEHLGEIVIAD